MWFKILLLVVCLLMLNGAQAEDIEHIIMSDPVLKEKYGKPCTSINGIEFSSLPKPDVSLQKLIDSASDGDTRYISSGYYTNTTTYHITKNLTLIGDGLVVADAERSCEILHVENPNAAVKIENIVFVNGMGEHGGVIDNDARSLILENCTLEHNIAYNGSCISNLGDSLVIKNCTLSNNFAAENGAIVEQNGDATIEGSTFVNNTAYGNGSCISNLGSKIGIKNTTFENNYARHNGGCIYDNASFAMESLSPTTMSNSKFISNTAERLGAAIYSERRGLSLESSTFSQNNGTSPIFAQDEYVVLKSCNISNNLGPFGPYWAAYGGGINCCNCTVLIEKCIIHDNKARVFYQDLNSCMYAGTGAGICFLESKATMNNTIIERNEAVMGGGIAAKDSNVEINGGVIKHNIARTAGSIKGTGGAIYASGQVILRGVLIEDNHADEMGGAILNWNELILDENTILAGNTANKGAAIYSHEHGEVKLQGNAQIIDNQATISGGIYNEGTLNINGSIISDNQGMKGGAIYNEIGGVIKSGDHTIFQNNSAQDGGAIYNVEGGKIDLKGNPEFINNEAIDTGDYDYREGMGGAVFNAGNLTIENGVFTGNKAISGSSIWNEGNLTDTNSQYSKNYAIAAGTIFHKQNTMILNNPTISGNVADQDGGGIYTSGSLVVNDGIMDYNMAKNQGGALYCVPGYSSAPITIYLDGLVILNNTASLDGGAIYSSGKVALALHDTEIVKSVAGRNGGGVFLNTQSSIDLGNSVIVKNVAKKGGGIYLTKGSTMTGNKNQVHDNTPDNVYQAK